MWAHSNLFPRPTVGNVRDVDAACVCAISGFVCHSLSGGERSRVCVSLTERARSARELGRAERRAHCEAARLGSAHGGGYIVYVSCVGLVISYYFSLWPVPAAVWCFASRVRVRKNGGRARARGAAAGAGGVTTNKLMDWAPCRETRASLRMPRTAAEIDLLRSSSFLYRFNTISLFTVDYGLHRLVSCVR